MSSGGSTGHSDQFGPWWQHGSSAIDMASGNSPDYRHLIVPRWQHGPWASSQTWAVVGPWTQTWPPGKAQALPSPWPQVAAQTPQIDLFLTSPAPPLPVVLELLCFSFSPSLHHVGIHGSGSCLHGLLGQGPGTWVSSGWAQAAFCA